MPKVRVGSLQFNHRKLGSHLNPVLHFLAVWCGAVLLPSLSPKVLTSHPGDCEENGMGVVVLSWGTELHSHTTVGHCVTALCLPPEAPPGWPIMAI